MKAAAIILAAGASTRLGKPKQIVKVGGERLLERALRVCLEAELEPVIVVLGAEAETIQAECDLRGARVVINDAWHVGMASSLHAGVSTVANEAVDATVVMTCDMPFVDAGHLRALLVLADETQSDVASAYGGRHGVPGVFFRSSFGRLEQLSGDAGARSLLMNAPAVELRDASDVDTPEALMAAQDAAAKVKS